MDYESTWRRVGPYQFGSHATDVWADTYVAATGCDPGDLVVVDPGNGFNYLFDLAGTLGDAACDREPRVLGVWGRSQPRLAEREAARLRGHPRPGHADDDRGHLIAFASGGGYDINLVPMAAELNRGWSAEGTRFRAMERRAAAVPGTLFFIHPIYDDATARPARFEVGVQDGEILIVDSFVNVRTSRPRAMSVAILRQATAFDLDAELVAGCLDRSNDRDELFHQAWREGVTSLENAQRNTIAGITGHVAESVTELLLNELGWHVIWHFADTGRHGVDLVFLTADDRVIAIEVKGTLVAGKIPRLSRRELAQMSTAWIDNPDNPGMAELELRSEDVYGGVVTINFADMTWRIALTADFRTLRPVLTISQLDDLTSLLVASEGPSPVR